MSFQGQQFVRNSWSATSSGDASTRHKSSSSSSSSAADVDVHAAWDNYDLAPPLPAATRRRSDDRCSLLTHSTDSTASLKSCRSHNAAVSRSSFASLMSATAADSDSGAGRQRAGTCRRHPGFHDRCHGRRLDSMSPSYQTEREFATTTAERCQDDGTRRRQSSSWRDRRPSTWSRCEAARRRRDGVDNDDDDDYITTSSEGEDQPSTSTSSFTPSNCADDRASLLTSSSTSSSSAPIAAPPRNCARHQYPRLAAEPSPCRGSSHRYFPSPRRRTSSRSLATSNDVDEDDLQRSRSSEEVAVTLPSKSPRGSSRHFPPSPGRRTCSRSLTTVNDIEDDAERSASSEEFVVTSCHRGSRATAGACREDDLRAVRSLFEFRSRDELRIANDFIEGVWSLCSRRSLYNEQRICPNPAPLISTPPTSVFQLYYSGSENDLSIGCEAGEIVAKYDKKSSVTGFKGNKQRSMVIERNNQGVGVDNSSNHGLNVADVVVHRDGADALEYWNGWRKEIRTTEMIDKLKQITATISNEDDLNIHIQKSPITVNDNPNNSGRSRDTEVSEHRAPLFKLVNCDYGKQMGDVAATNAPFTHLDEKVAVATRKSTDLSTLLKPEGLADIHGLRTLMEGPGMNSRLATDIIQVFDALLVRPSTREATSVADVNVLHPLTPAINDRVSGEHCDTMKFLQADTDRFITALTKSTGDDCGNKASTDKISDSQKSGAQEKKKEEPDILPRLAPRLSLKSDLSCDPLVTNSTDRTSRNAEGKSAEQSSPRQPACCDNCTAPPVIDRKNDLNDFIDDLQSAGETRKRVSRRSRGRGKVRDLIRLFESVSASTLDNNSSPVDVRRATISAAVSVGELLRRFSEQEVMSCGQCSRALLEDNAEQPRISSPNVVEVRSAADAARAPQAIADECRSKREEETVGHKSTARWPTVSRFRRRHFQRRTGNSEASVCDHAESRLNSDRLSENCNSRSDDRTTSVDNVERKDLSHFNVTVRRTSETVRQSSKSRAKLTNENQSEHQDSSVVSSEQPETHRCNEVDVTTTFKLPIAVGFSGLPAELNLSPPTARQLSASSPSPSQRPLKSLHYRESAVTENPPVPSSGGSGDVGDRHQEVGHAPSDLNKCSAAHYDDYTASDKPTLPVSTGFLREQPITTVSPENVSAKKRYNSAKMPPPRVAKDDHCRRFTVRSWFVAGGPCLEEVPRSPVTSAKNAVATFHRSKSRAPAKATLTIETSCSAAYPVLRMTGVTVQLANEVDVSNKEISEDSRTAGVDCAVDSSLGQEKLSETQKNNSSSYEVQPVKGKSGGTVPRLRTDDKELAVESASWKQHNETVNGDSATNTLQSVEVFALPTKKTAEPNHEFDVVASTVVGFRDRGAVGTAGSQKCPDCPKGDYCNSATSRLSASQSSARDATFASCDRRRSVKSQARSDDLPSKRSSSDKKCDHLRRQATHCSREATSPVRRSSIMAECGLVSSEPIQSPDGVTVVYTRRRLVPDRWSTVVTDTTPSHLTDRTRPSATDSYNRLAQYFLLASLLEYRLYDERK